MTSGMEIILGSWELFSARHEHSISVPDSTSLNHCSTDDVTTPFYTCIKFDEGVTSRFHTFRAENSLSKGKSIYYLLLIIHSNFFLTLHLGTRGCRKWEMFVTLYNMLMFVTLQHAIATPITTPNSRYLINKTSFEGCPVEGDACILGVRT